MARQEKKCMKTTNQKVSSKILSVSEKVIHQLMMFNKCTHERAVCMYKEMLETIADYYLLESKVSSKILRHDEIETFANEIPVI